MRRILEVWRKLRRLPRRRALDRELAEEMRQHIEWRTEELIADGRSPENARRAARLAFGNPVSLTERGRDAWSFLRLETWLQDAAYGVRLFWRDRGWTLTAAATLALGIGGTVAIFTFVNAFVLRPLPFPEPDRLVHVWAVDANLRIRLGRISAPDFIDLRREATLFADLAAFNYTEEDLTGGSEPERVPVGRITANAFGLLGAAPSLGRGFSATADQAGGPREVVLSDRFWRTRFGGDPQVLGRTLHVNGQPHTVIGVMPPDFVFPLPVTQLWAPRVLDAPNEARSRRYLQVFGRMNPGVSRPQAEADLRAIASRLAERHPADNANFTVRVVPLRDALNFASEIMAPMSAALAASVFFVFLIVCANVANLMLARGIARTHELALRAALGAGRWRLVRQLLTEAMLLAIAGGAAGVLLASWSLSRISGAVPPFLYRVGALAIDRDALAFSVAVSLLSVGFFGVLPAIRSTRPDPNEMLKQGGRGSAVPQHRRSQQLLVVGQIAMSAVLLIAAVLMVGSVRALRQVPLGFDPNGVLTAKLVLPASRYAGVDDVRRFHRDLTDRLAVMPGLDAASTVDFLPLNHEFPIVEAFAGGTPVEAGEGTQATALSVSEGYFTTMGVPLLRGRVVTDRDDAMAPPMVVISQPLAETLFGSLDALDRTVVLRSRSGAEHRYTVVGVVAGTRHGTLKEAADGHVYLPQQQQPTRVLRALVRATNPAAQAATLREAVRRLDPQLAVTEIRTMNAVVEEFLAPEINVANALAEQSITALLLALVGLYGVTAFAAARRSKEIGVRMALGASPAQILRLIVGQGVRTGASGIVIGLLAAYGLTRFLTPFVYGLNAADPVVFGGVAVVLFTCTVLACHLPARRASRLDPVHVLRTEG